MPSFRLIRFTMLKMSRTMRGARAELGSSSMMSLGRAMRPRPMTSICTSPPLRVAASWRRRSPRTGK